MSYEFADGYKIRNQSATHFLTFSTMGWIDIFTRQRYRDLILESFNFCRQKKALQIGTYVIMSNHIPYNMDSWKFKSQRCREGFQDIYKQGNN